MGLVGCGKDKLEGVHPARKLYTGLLFRWALEEAERTCDEVYVLSAKHHVLPLDQPTENYDKELPGRKAELDAWARRTGEDLRGRFPGLGVHLVVLASKKYAQAVKGCPGSWTFEEPMAGLEIGERLGWLKQRREAAMERRPVSNVAHYTVLKAAHLRAGDDLERTPAGWEGTLPVPVRHAYLDNGEVVVVRGGKGDGRETRHAPNELVLVRGRRGHGRAPVQEVVEVPASKQRRLIEEAIDRWAAKMPGAPLSPGHREQIATVMVQVGDGVDGVVTKEMVHDAIMIGGDPGVSSYPELEAAGLGPAAQRAFDGWWLAEAAREVAGQEAARGALWSLVVPASARLVVVTDRAVDGVAYHQVEGREGTVYVAVGGPLDDARKAAVRDLLEAVARGPRDAGQRTMVVAAFENSRAGTEMARELRALVPAGMAWDRHTPNRGRWADEAARRSGVRLESPEVGRGGPGWGSRVSPLAGATLLWYSVCSA